MNSNYSISYSYIYYIQFICGIIAASVILVCTTMLICGKTVSADSNRYTCREFSVLLPDGFTVDDTSIDNYVSFYSGQVTAGVSIAENTEVEDITYYTEKKIAEIAADTVSSLNGSAAQDEIVASMHDIVAFSENSYPAVYILYKGESDSGVYIEEYIIPTEEYIYTAVISAGSEKDLALSGIDTFKNSFSVYGHMLTRAESTADNKELLIIFIAALAVVLCVGILVIVKLSRKNRKSL